MFEVDIFSVCAATLVAIAIGIVWYSPWLFGRIWMHEVEHAETLEAVEGQWKRVVIAGVSQWFLFFAIAHILTLFTGTSLRVLVLSLVVALGAVLFGPMVGERRSTSYAALTLGYMAVVVTIGTYVLAYWPW